MGEGVGGDGTVHRPHLHTCVGGVAQGGAKGGVGGIVGTDGGDALHLDDEQHRGAVALLHGTDKMAQMLDPALCGGIGEVAHVVHFEGAALDLHEPFLVAILDVKIQAGVAVGDLAAYRGAGKASRENIGGHGIGGLAVHIDEAIALVYCDDVVGGLAVGICRLLQYDGATGH